jgi:hypothetical protein
MSDKYLRLNVANEKYTITCSDYGAWKSQTESIPSVKNQMVTLLSI